MQLTGVIAGRLDRAVGSIRSAGALRDEERAAAGPIGAVVWAIASLSVVAMAVVLPSNDVHRTAVISLGVGGALWGSVSGLVLDYRRIPVWVIHASTVSGIAAIAAAVELSGGARSPAWACLFYVVVFSAYFFQPPAAFAYFLGCVAVELAVVIGSPGGSRPVALAKLMVAAPSFMIAGAAILAGKRFMWNLRLRSEELAAEQGALRRVATAVVDGEPADRFYQLVAVEAGQLLDASGAGILRLEPGEELVILGTWAREPERQYQRGTRIPVAAGSDLAKALDEGRPLRVGTHAPETELGALGYQSSIVAPLTVSGRTWGFLTVVAERVGAWTAEDERRLTEFGDLIAAAVTNIEDRAALSRQAATDALTGLANRRTLQDRLAADLARGRRHGTPVAVAIIDVDRFKLINDGSGHDAGDGVLIAVARALSSAARAEDTVARVGGDEFAWILPDTSGEEALFAVQRARASVGAAEPAQPRVTISAGVCDSAWTSDPAELLRLADRALYSAKYHGRDQVCVYSPRGADELAPH